MKQTIKIITGIIAVLVAIRAIQVLINYLSEKYSNEYLIKEID